MPAKRVAILGLGAVTRNIHLPAYAELKDKIEVVAGCDPDTASRKIAKEKWGISALYENAEEMIKKEQPDILSICTPPFLHHEQSLMALSHGCHLFCEKPLADNMAQIDDIIQASEKAKRFVVVNSQFPYMKIHTAARNQIGSPAFGKLLFVHAWQTFRTTNHTEAGWRGKMSRRLCFEFGVHVFEIIRALFDVEPVTISAQMPSPGGKEGPEVVNIISITFSDGRVASIVLDRLSKGPERYLDMRLDGERASVYTSIGGEVRLEIGMHTRERSPFFGFNFVKGGKAVLQDGNTATTLAQDGMNPFASATAVHLRQFVDALENGTEPKGTAKDNRKTMALVFASYDSADKGLPVNVKDY